MGEGRRYGIALGGLQPRCSKQSTQKHTASRRRESGEYLHKVNLFLSLSPHVCTPMHNQEHTTTRIRRFTHAQTQEHTHTCCVLSPFSRVRLCATRWTSASSRFFSPGDSPGKNTGVGCHALRQRIFLAQGSNLRLLHCRQILYRWATWEAHITPPTHTHTHMQTLRGIHTHTRTRTRISLVFPSKQNI